MRKLILIFVLLASCKAEPETGKTQAERACAYNDRLIDFFAPLFKARADLWQAMVSENQRKTDEELKNLGLIAQNVLDSLKMMGDFQGNANLKTAAEELCTSIQNDASEIHKIYSIVFTDDAVDTTRISDTVADFNDSLDPNAELGNRYQQLISRFISEEYSTAFRTAQEDFANKYDFDLAK
jgi:predicted unusual protein kinase regulating ubiquinone biosynthesis (AarF/ABC1/UbiB family)